MIATSRIQRRYDHRLKVLVKSAGSIDIALEHGIPRSTARGWLRRHDSPLVVSTDVVNYDAASLQVEVLALRSGVFKGVRPLCWVSGSGIELVYVHVDALSILG